LGAIGGFFLRAKHWQIFVLVWGAYFVAVAAMIASIPEGPVTKPVRVAFFAEAVISPFLAFFMGWLWSMGSFLSSIAEPSLKLNIHVFRFALIFPTVYLFTAPPFFLSSSSSVVESIELPLHLLALCCLLYAFYFVSKSLVTVEKGGAVTSNDYALTLLLLFFSLIGIWLIQPRINRLYAQNAA
jgi:hypothetical protein